MASGAPRDRRIGSQLHEELAKVSVPEGAVGGWSVRRFVITETYARQYNDFHRAQWGAEARTIEPGVYTGLYGPGGDPWMSDAHAEQVDHQPAIRRIERLGAGGCVLLNGLGLGLVLQAALRRGSRGIHAVGVARVDVVEIQPEVVQLVAPHYRAMAARTGVELNIIQGDALTYRFPPGQQWDVAWHDIWPGVSADNIPTMSRLHRRYGRRARWQGSWCRDEALWLRRQ